MIRQRTHLIFVSLLCGFLLVVGALRTAAASPTATSPQGGSPFVETNVQLVYSYTGQAIGDTYGWVGAAIGDINGDGLSEFIVTAPYQGAAANGRAYVYSGGDGTLLNTVTGGNLEAFGYSAAAAGDVNNDTIPDYVISGNGVNVAPNQFTGRVIVYSGANHNVLHNWAGNPGDAFGADVAGGYDVNNDNHDDIIVGAQFYSTTFSFPPAPNYGRVYLYSGADGSILWTREGAGGDWLGAGVGFIEDVSNDGVADVVAAANRGNVAYVFSGVDGSTIYTLTPTVSSSTYGQFFADSAGDVNNDGIPDIYIGDYAAVGGRGRTYLYSGADGSWLYTIEGAPGDGIGGGRGIGDVNGDNHDDLIIAAYSASDGVTGGGRVDIYSGADPTVILHTVTGNVVNDNLGVDALSVGDINGYGGPEYLITAVGLDFLGLDVGKAYIISFDAPLIQPIFLPLMQK